MRVRRVTPRLILGGVLGIAVLVFLGYRMWPQLGAALSYGSAGYASPDFRLVTLAGDSVSLEELRGQVVLVNFWATWCPPCRHEMPGFQRVYDARKDQGFTVLGISTDVGGRGAVDDFIEEHGITYPVAMASGTVARDFGGVRALPTSFLLDRQGRIRHTVTGVFTETALEEAVDWLLAEDHDEPGARH